LPPPPSKNPDDYVAVIPYRDVFKLFEMLNKHVAGRPPKKKKKKKKRRRREEIKQFVG
jgi:hypothetical protein